MNCRSRPQRLEEGSSRGNTALFITDGSRKGTPNRLKTANREEKALSSTKRGCFEEKVLILAGSSTKRGCFVDKVRF